MLLEIGLLLLSARVGSAVHAEVSNHWDGGFQVNLDIPICADLDGWNVHLVFDADVDTLEVWVGDSQQVSSTEFVVTNKDYNGVLHSGDTLSITFLGHGTGDIHPSVEATIEGMTCDGSGSGSTGTGSTGSGTGSTGTGSGTGTGSSGTSQTGGTHTGGSSNLPSTGGGSSNKDYADALGKSILFYDAQRSGRLPANNPIPWRGDSALQDCVVGGWYDAGDHVKFGLPFGSTALLLLWGMDLFKDGYQQAGQVDQFYDMIKWATDYMLDAWNPSSQELVVQIGTAANDHSFWGRPEDMTMDRPCIKARAGHSCSDVAGEWAASLAAGSIVFRDKGDTDYADRLLEAAKSLYEFAKANPGKYTDVVPSASGFYASSGYKDEMCEGGMWLYRATNNEQYLNDAKSYHESKWAWALSWDDKTVACQLLLYDATQDDTYKQEVVGYMTGWLPSGQVPYTPCGLAWRDKWGANRYAGNSAFLALAAAEAGIETAAYRKWAVEQINYLLGDNHQDGGCFSFAIDVGTKFPRQPHHRAASCPDKPAPCSEAQLHAQAPSPHLLKGALVGGPDQQGNYRDSREDYVVNEVAIDYNSGYHSALAGIVHLQATDNLPPTNNKCACNH